MQTSSSPSLAKAALWVSGWLAMMLTMAITGREAMHELSVFQLLLLRSVIGLAMVYPLVRAQGGWAAMRHANLKRHTARNLVQYAAQYGWFAAIAMIPLAQVVAIEFTMPIWITLMAAAFLGERLTGWKCLAMGLALLGVLVIVRPQASGLGTGQLVALAAAVGFAAALTLTKALTRTETPVSIIFWMLVIQTVIGLWPALAVWRWPSAGVWPYLLVVGFCGAFSHYCMARAMNHADASVVVPMDFLRVPLTALAGWWIYSEPVDALMGVGAALILAGNALNLMRVRKARLAAEAAR